MKFSLISLALIVSSVSTLVMGQSVENLMDDLFEREDYGYPIHARDLHPMVSISIRSIEDHLDLIKRSLELIEARNCETSCTGEIGHARKACLNLCRRGGGDSAHHTGGGMA